MPKYGSEELKDGQYSIKNNSLVWDLKLTDGVLKSTRIRNTKTKEVLDLSGEDFSIKLGPTKDLGWIIKDGEQIFASKTGKTITPEECQPLDIVREKTKTSLLFYYEPFQIILNLEFTHDPKENFIRRSLSLTSYYDKELVVEEVVLGDWNIDYTAQGGGKGLPAFINNKWFLSGEEPWFETKVSPNHILLAHHPSAYLNKGDSWTTDSAIIGGGTENARAILKDYVRSVMLPPKFFSLYNTWYDIRKEELNADNVVNNFLELQNKLIPHGASIDYCVIDDGWFDKDTLYEADTNTFPNGLKGVSDIIVSNNSKFGLWLPYSGLYLDNKTLREKYPFEEASSQFFCLSGTNYFSALSKRLEEVVKEDRVSFFKHDFNYFNCTMPRHGHLRNIYQGAEANMRRTAELLDLERKTDPEMIQALTTGINLSPWWLKYAHILWMGGGDVDYSANHPVTTRSAAEMTYRDGLLYHLLKEKEIFFPLYALMTHGIIDGKLNSVVPWVTNSQWADYVMNYMGRGTAIRELFIYYPKLDEKKSEILAKALNWADEHNAQMRNSEMILGNPNKNELYGFRGHDDQGNIYVSIRNPKLTDEEVTITDLGIETEYYRVSYPYHKVCETKTLPKLQILAESVLIVESQDLKSLTKPAIINARTEQ
ncbi:alpha-galactosidase, partial [bacterium]|nr:alpha-galactosidase [bacterium]